MNDSLKDDSERSLLLVITAEEQGERLDRIIGSRGLEYSRSVLQRWIAHGRVLVDGRRAKSNARPKQGSVVRITPEPPPPSTAIPQDIPLEVLFEDADLLVLNKPAGMVIHPAPGHPSGTLVNALRFHTSLPDDGDWRRPGIVHRLDKETSGVLVIAKLPRAREHLIAQFKKHAIERRYHAIVLGHPPEQASFNTLYSRHPVDRKRFTARADRGKNAITHMRTIERLHASALVECKLDTGRTHQIRVHLSEAGYPVLADSLYGRTSRDERLIEAARLIRRQALHASVLGFEHPVTGELLRFETALPEVFDRVLEVLRERSKG
ncbi:MAG: RluA family pseudouridine synthase [Deltaproteobacteria bacterium]|nr:RluA family pseudouridine synthase [Deltaproteobacteria bacterium]